MTNKSAPSREALREKKISELQNEIDNEIARAARLARKCNLWDLRFFIYLLRLNRISMLSNKNETTQPSNLLLHMNDDALKYAIQLTAKYANWHDAASVNQSMNNYDSTRAQRLMEATRKINGLFDHAMLLNVSEIENECNEDGNQEWKLSDRKEHPDRALERDFGLRIEEWAMWGKDNTINIPELICKLLQKYGRLHEIFEAGHNIALDDYCVGLVCLCAAITRRLKSQFDEPDSDALIDQWSIATISNITRLMIFTDSELEMEFDDVFIKYLHNNSYDATQLSDSELRFHYISRKPFLRGNGFMILSPELVFDSIMDNCHYTLLENNASKNAYQAEYGRQFVNEVAQSAEKNGYVVKGRDIYLGSPRKSIGDIDLVLENPQTGHTLFIECKNHKLPLDVQFRTTGKVKKHIELTLKWEKKVQKRIDHLKGPSPDYTVEGTWDYVVVSFMPQPLSHQSELLIMSIREFELWLSNTPRARNFPELFKQIYETNIMRFSNADIDNFNDASFAFIKPVI
ncbi:hypothetical protein I4P56_19960 [Enterobacter hormaechei]|uniref:hypothetical protein n=1 Tax=Enterobacter hormaechei TaxID=158836 RepID=UPI0018C1D7C8|nr:hypothetical protein [Enterobacter hormaechei]MBF9848084.1 hypothetical protein [Enterobacter hormaechei]